MSASFLIVTVTAGSSFSMHSLTFAAWLVLVVLVGLLVPTQIGFEKLFDYCSTRMAARRQMREESRKRRRRVT